MVVPRNLLLATLKTLLKAVGNPKPIVWDEQVDPCKLNLNDGIATIWMGYAFFIDDEFSHCGVNAIQLLKEAEIWKIIYIIDTRKQHGCNITDFPATN